MDNKLKKISWRKVKGGRAFEHILEGYVDDKLGFRIEGSLSVTDLRESKKSLETNEYIQPKHYKLKRDGVSLTPRIEAKTIASDLLNGLNIEKHQNNWQKGEDEAAHTLKIMEKAQAFLESLKNK